MENAGSFRLIEYEETLPASSTNKQRGAKAVSRDLLKRDTVLAGTRDPVDP